MHLLASRERRGRSQSRRRRKVWCSSPYSYSMGGKLGSKRKREWNLWNECQMLALFSWQSLRWVSYNEKENIQWRKIPGPYRCLPYLFTHCRFLDEFPRTVCFRDPYPWHWGNINSKEGRCFASRLISNSCLNVNTLASTV